VPVTVATRSKTCVVFGRAIAGSNLARGMCVRVFSVVLSCVGRGLASG
jgi:hypothetical protein